LMIYGETAARPIVVDDALGIVKIFDAGADFEKSSLKDRPYLNLALFWGQDWNKYIDTGKLDQLRPEDVKHLSGPTDDVPIRGKLYQSCGDAPAVIHLTAV